MKCRKNANTKNFEGGRGGQKNKSLCWISLVFFALYSNHIFLGVKFPGPFFSRDSLVENSDSEYNLFKLGLWTD